MKNNQNKLFGGLGPEKAGEVCGSAPHKCRGRECEEEAHAAHSKEQDQHTSKLRDTGTMSHSLKQENIDRLKAKNGHTTSKDDGKAASNHKKDY